MHCGSDAIRRHAEEGRYVLDRVNLAVTEGSSHQRLAFSFAKQGDNRRFAGLVWITDDSPCRERGRFHGAAVMRSARFRSHNRDLSQDISLSHPLLSVLGVEKLRGWDKLLSKPRNR